jgi:2-keto-4-pentenoate hydratase/2-oxohepta-3-ene-1,7-dioic acid hydratase in catechol pathway
VRLVTFQQEGRVSVGAPVADSDPWPCDSGIDTRIYDFNQPALRRLVDEAKGPTGKERLGMIDLVRSPRGTAARIGRALAALDPGAMEPGAVLPLAAVQLLAPLRPGKIVAIGRNYADHALETGVAPFEQPRIIFKLATSVVGPGAVVCRPAGVAKLDFEVELAVVIGRTACRVARAAALDYVAGYTILDDVSAREFQFDVTPAQTSFAKSMDGFAPMGPCLVTADEIADPQRLRLATRVNGKLMQDATTADMLFPVDRLIEYISGYITLEPGDVIATGTPAGIGAFRKPPVWLQPGDHIDMRIEGIGRLEHRIGDESGGLPRSPMP